jgi:amino acid adenylation domain-containing protein
MNLINALSKAAIADKAGMTFINPAGFEERMSYKDLYHRACCISGALQQKGVKPGNELVIQTEDNKSLICLFWGCLLGGIIPVPLSPGIQSEQKMKVFSVWNCLSNPWLACDADQASRIMQEAQRNASVPDIVNLLLLPDLLQNNELVDIEEVAASNLAYIQYSSGSTGEPKGVCLTHTNLICNISDIIKSLAITETDILLSWMPLTHDMGLIGFHLTGILKNIDTIVIPTSLFVRRPLIWMHKTHEHRASVLYAPNSGLQYFLSALEKGSPFSWDLSCVRVLINGAETIALPVCHQFTHALKQYGLNEKCIATAYGLAEASVEVSAMPVGSPIRCYYLQRDKLNVGDTVRFMEEEGPEAVSFIDVGFPVSGCEVRVCDDNDIVLSGRTIGHIQIRGNNVTAGYYNNKEATRKLFTNDHWLKTGDLGFIHEERLVFTGRIKNIIIINGQNYFPQDIERILVQAGIAEPGKVVACGIREQADKLEKLVIFILYKGAVAGFLQMSDAVRKEIMQCFGLLVHEVVPVKKIPKTTSGKVQYFLLAEQYEKSASGQLLETGTGSHFMSSDRTAIRQELINIVEQMGFTQIDGHTNLFASGMNSISVLQFSGCIYRSFGVTLPAEIAFRNNNINDICEFIIKAGPGVNTPPELTADDPVSFELSFAQRRIWMEHLLNNISSAYHIPVVYKINGQFKPAVFESAVRALLMKHAILRTSFESTESEPRQQVHKYDEKLFKLSYSDLSQVTHKLHKAEDDMEQFINAPFTLEIPAQLRVKVIKIAPEEYLLVFVIHHILIDGWSMATLFSELCDNYNLILAGGDPIILKPAIQFDFYVKWQRLLTGSKLYEQHRTYWLQELEDLPEPVGFSAKRRPADEMLFCRVKSHRYSFEKEDFDLIKKLAKKFETTPFGILMTLLHALLFRYSGKKDIVTGFDVSGRSTGDIDKVIGYTLNTLCLRTKIRGSESFADLVNLVVKKIFSAIDHQLYPFEQVLEDKKTQPGLSFNPLFDLLVLYQNFFSPGFKLNLNDCTLERKEAAVNDGFIGLLVEFTEEGATLNMRIQYDESVYSLPEITRFPLHLRNLLQSVVENDSQSVSLYHFLTTEEKERLFPQAHGYFEVKHIRMPVHQLFEKWATYSPNAIAIYAGNRDYTYQQLNERVNQLAHFIMSRCNIKPDDRIGFMVARNEHIVIAMLAILKTGAAYVAIDPELPAARIGQIVADSGAKLLLTDLVNEAWLRQNFGNDLLVIIEQQQLLSYSKTNPVYKGIMNNLAYVVYTSGSSGRPKGVMIEHLTLVNYVRYFIRYFNITEQDVIIQQASVSFDTMVEEIFPALCTAAKIVIVEHGGRDIDELRSVIFKYQATVLSTTPMVLNEINKHVDSRIATLRVVISGGDTLHPSYINRLLPNVPVYNTYGPSETTVCATYHQVQTVSDAPLIGKPVADYRIYILDENRQLMPWGKTGEIYIEGGLGRGYLNEPELTAEKFLESQFTAGRRMYASGDRGRFTEDGVIEFLGRSDQQVKVRGHRIELHEIEKVISLYPGVRATVVVQSKQSDYLVAFMTINRDFSGNRLRLHISEHLPAYMMPYRFEIIEKFPLTSSGKIDRNLLQVQPQLFTGQQDELSETLTGIPLQLAGLVKKVLELTTIDINDNFFELGCNSIKATRIAGLIKKELEFQVEVRDLFIYPTITLLSEKIMHSAGVHYQAVLPVKESPHYPLSPGQNRLWILHQLNKNSSAYNESHSYEIKGEPDIKLMIACFDKMAARHSILRTSFSQVNDEPVQVIHDIAFCPVNFIYADCSEATRENAEAMLNRLVEQPFDLKTAPLYRVILIKTAATQYYFSVVMHHIITDDWSCELFIREFGETYRSSNEKAAAPVLQYRDYVIWAQNNLREEKLSAHRQFWMDLYKDGVPVLELPYDFKRPVLKTYEGAAEYIFVDHTTFLQLRAFCRENNISLFMLLLSASAVLFYRYSDQQDIVIGTPVAGRSNPELEEILGFFINTLPLRIHLEGNERLDALVQQVKNICLDAYEHQHYPFDNLVNELAWNRDPARSSLFDVLINLSTRVHDDQVLLLDDMVMERLNKQVTGSKYDLAIYFEEHKNGLSCMFEYDKHLFTASTIKRMVVHFTNILTQFLRNTSRTTGEIEFIGEHEKEQLLHDFSKMPEIGSGDGIVGLFAKQVAINGSKTAIVCGGKEFSYEFIYKQANMLAARLTGQFLVKPDDKICLLLERSERIIIAILAIWKAGAAYVPIDPGFPTERIDYILKDTGASLYITDKCDVCSADRLRQYNRYQFCNLKMNMMQDVSDAADILLTGNMAYVMYTSGSTGQPKGVEIFHDSVMNVLFSLQHEPGISGKDTFLSVSNYTFDISVAEFFLPLISGARLVLTTQEEVMDMARLKALFESVSPTHMQATPSLWKALIDKGWDGLAQLKAITCGEPLPEMLLRQLLERTGQVWNMYGPTETTIFSTGKRLIKDELITIGSPLRNTKAYIVDRWRGLTPIGVYGELLIGGSGLARGYLNNQTLTNQKFIKGLFQQETVYATGDLARWLADGNIELKGRSDDQVKIRGIRVEPGEIENTLLGHPAIATTGVIVQTDGNGDKYIAAFIEYKIDQQESEEGLRSYLRQLLPSHMIPAYFIPVKKIPFTGNGKINRGALAKMDPNTQKRQRQLLLPETVTERKLLEIWVQILGRNDISTTDNFFDLGGHSLKANKLVNLVYRDLGVEINLVDVFRHSTVKELGALIAKLEKDTYNFIELS